MEIIDKFVKSYLYNPSIEIFGVNVKPITIFQAIMLRLYNNNFVNGSSKCEIGDMIQVLWVMSKSFKDKDLLFDVIKSSKDASKFGKKYINKKFKDQSYLENNAKLLKEYLNLSFDIPDIVIEEDLKSKNVKKKYSHSIEFNILSNALYVQQIYKIPEEEVMDMSFSKCFTMSLAAQRQNGLELVTLEETQYNDNLKLNYKLWEG